ncbi:bifunctional 4-hydroxy-2-oxoglutarate aldolase/2-dehydro-3-deoxy-phosphogluconate aldolase [Actinomadura chibensis]|uniref:Bifunctional 4-hydroxy-2-oxoglutarate aldolase/2-dehydro-3-deoxy-phosphogluconate aldolase n=1 Tax=Actinomadura chibensis TaxID=392828 RepID=A0A5D0NBT1_9ACTN|nr:bifunctional 4-hydroxy-2-oxoglutarate aldolase/2-dehydro-3-deoxy-phosphogluconate aldolase [Actinomadura chibensis]TYB41858.1 bifunctional 4-hydroxy-2-oxoglutarate aldolase/2-dehydro-3-deoxy-phosphogluconate aldolase [Actinomadura chibensis]
MKPETGRSPVPTMVVIFRGPSPEDIATAAEHLVAVGYRAFEVSLTTPDALTAIRLLAAAFEDVALIGAGTVRSVEDVARVREAGARMAISPVTSGPVIAAAKANGMLAVPGAYTPTEAVCAREHGADLVKLFPAASAGVDYFRMVREPLPDVPFLVTGGVDAPMAHEFLQAGAVSVGVGHKLLGGDHLEKHDWAAFKRQAARYLAVAHGESAAS